MKRIPKLEGDSSVLALILAFVNTVLFNIPFLGYVYRHSDGFGGFLVSVAFTLGLFVLTWIVFASLLRLCRLGGRIVIAVLFAVNAGCLYFISKFNVLLDPTMMLNVFGTDNEEAGGFVNLTSVLYLLLLGILPGALAIFLPKVRYEPMKKFLARTGGAVALLAVLVCACLPCRDWVRRHSIPVASLSLPWSYLVNGVRAISLAGDDNGRNILLPTGHTANSDKKIVVLVIGESSRRDHYQIYGYDRETNPLLSTLDDLVLFNGESDETYTVGGVRSILNHKPVKDDIYETLPDYLDRSGVEVFWRTNNKGEARLHISNYEKSIDILRKHSTVKRKFDDVLLVGLDELLRDAKGDKVFVVLHTSTSHGPTYYRKYPAEFQKFEPVIDNSQLSSWPIENVINTYDNTILFTDSILYQLIGILRNIPDADCSMLFVSDHGESLGEEGRFMHGIPRRVAPPEQYEIPFIFWTNDKSLRPKAERTASQKQVFHSVLHMLDIVSPVYKPEWDIFEK